MRFLVLTTAIATLTGCANYRPPTDEDFAAMRAAVLAAQPQVVMPMPMPTQSVICTSRPGPGGTATTACQ